MIKPVELMRGECGMFSHPDFPSWDEGTGIETISKWFIVNNGTYKILSMESDAPEEVSEKWFDGDNDYNLWKPQCNDKGAFLLSIHDTEDGPVAVFFIPLPAKPKTPLVTSSSIKNNHKVSEVK